MNVFYSRKNHSRKILVSSNTTVLPNKYSFKLVGRTSSPPALASAAIELKEKPLKVAKVAPQQKVMKSERASEDTGNTIDENKRGFLKLAGVLGLGVVAATALPDKAQAYVMGSSPTSTVIGVKNATNVRINPATEDTLALVEAQTAKLTFDGSDNLYVQAASDFATQIENASNVVINPATEDTLALINAQTAKLTFDGSNNLLTSVGGTGNIVGIKDTSSTQINPATDDSLVYLRRMVKIMESQAAVDTQNRQRVTIDSWGSVLTGPGTATGLSVPRVAVATDSAFNAAITSLNGWNQQMFQDVARNTYANGIRTNLAFA